MHDAFPLTLTAHIAEGIVLIGRFYLLSPARISKTFGLTRRHPMWTRGPGHERSNR